ncbi:MAG: hypothetical protein ACOY90_05665 [Candidatus Zhuqueibacterota bacterium]
MRLNCQHVSADEAGGEIFQILFEEKEDQCDEPYVLIQRAWLEEDEGEFSPIYVETHDERLIGHYRKVDAVLTRSHLTLRLPPPTEEVIEIDFTTSDSTFRKVKRMLGIILQRDTDEDKDANIQVDGIRP